MVGCGVFRYSSGTTYEGEFLCQNKSHNEALDRVLRHMSMYVYVCMYVFTNVCM